MNKDQKYSPKYWVCHHPKDEDVSLNTADKVYSTSIQKMIKITNSSIPGGSDLSWEDLEEQGWMCSLVELNLVDLNRVL